MRRALNILLKAVLPLLVAGVILWWMYRGFDWDDLRQTLRSDVRWGWMLASMPFGVMAQVLRALRWRLLLEPLGEHPRRSTCVHSIFLSFGSSLVVPRVGEVLRCGVLSRYDGTNFTRAVGSVVTERIIDILVALLVSLAVLASQVPVFVRFFEETGFTLPRPEAPGSLTGYLLAAVGVALLVAVVYFLIRRFGLLSRTRHVMHDFQAGIASVAHLRRPWLFGVYTVGIWLSYFLHFSLTFFCFAFTEHLGLAAALVAYVVGSYAVLVPTPNGAGPWHYVVKTALTLFGVPAANAATFVLVVHTTQTLLVLLLGIYAAAALALTKRTDTTTS